MAARTWAFLRQLYSPKTLDSRFIEPPESDEPTKLSRTSAAGRHDGDGTEAKRTEARKDQPKWRTFEYRIYSVVMLIAIPLMLKQVISVSRPGHPNYPLVAPYLSRGWIMGRRKDNSDHQFASFRNNMPYLVFAGLLQIGLRAVFDGWMQSDKAGVRTYFTTTLSGGRISGSRIAATSRERIWRRTRFDLAFGLVFITILHGTSMAKIVAVVSANYLVAKHTPARYTVLATWVFNIGILFANEHWRGYPYESLVGAFVSPAVEPGTATPVRNWGFVLDRYHGLIPRWELLFKFTILRLISFNLDNHWKDRVEKKPESEVAKAKEDCQDEDYSLATYFAYVLYAPLYLAGPILTFEMYVSQCRFQPASIQTRRTVMYAIRFVAAYLSMELFIHYVYVVAIFRARPRWSTYTAFELSMLGFFNLIHIWMKLLLPWRFFRLWALFDHVDPPENMIRCMSNNYSVRSFWRGWHASYNRWVVRYIYVPLSRPSRGGWFTIGQVLFKFATVFTFVALWHDIRLRLLQWSWLISLFVLPELIASWLLPAKDWPDRPNQHRLLSGAGGVVNIVMMIIANLVGFAIGLDGISGLVSSIMSSYSSLSFAFMSFFVLFVTVQVMFEVRKEEARNKIRIRC